MTGDTMQLIIMIVFLFIISVIIHNIYRSFWRANTIIILIGAIFLPIWNSLYLGAIDPFIYFQWIVGGAIAFIVAIVTGLLIK